MWMEWKCEKKVEREEQCDATLHTVDSREIPLLLHYRLRFYLVAFRKKKNTKILYEQCTLTYAPFTWTLCFISMFASRLKYTIEDGKQASIGSMLVSTFIFFRSSPKKKDETRNRDFKFEVCMHVLVFVNATTHGVLSFFTWRYNCHILPGSILPNPRVCVFLIL